MHTIERQREQLDLERQLREEILAAPAEERPQVTSKAYGILFERFPDHDVFSKTPEQRRRAGAMAAGMFAPLVGPGARVLEVGCGRGDLLAELARRGCTCSGIEPSEHMISICREAQSGMEVRQGTAERLEFDDASFDLVFSQQVIEHLHPEDVERHFAEAHRVLAPGGILALETPNRTTGPQDVSRGLTAEAEGLHLKEWTVAELAERFRAAGFVKVGGLLAPPVLARRSPLLHRMARASAAVKRVEDAVLRLVPGLRLRTLVGKALGLDDIFLYATKPRGR